MLGAALPTGRPTDELVVDGESYTTSIVDATNVTVFVRAGTLGLDGTESPTMIEDDEGLLERLEKIRAAACLELGLVDEEERASIECPTRPFVAVVSLPGIRDNR